jgi:5-methylthioadenosine/S-adenosylhomocysteine deaminase
MHVVLGEVILDYPTPSAKNAQEALMTTEVLLKKYAAHPLVSVAVAPHSVYALSKENLSKVKKLADKYEAPVHIHCSETKSEVGDCLEKHGVTPVAYLDQLGLLNERCILAHCVWLTDKDIDIIAAKKVHVAHCPISNLKLGSGIAPIAELLEKNVNVALGSDGAASSNRLDIWEAGKYAALLQKGITNNPANISLQDVYEMMSVNGMKALGLNNLVNMDSDKIRKKIADIKNSAILYEKNIEQIRFEI